MNEPVSSSCAGRVSSNLKLPFREVIHNEALFRGAIRLYWSWKDVCPTWIDFEIFAAIDVAGPDDVARPVYCATEKRDSTVEDEVTLELDRAVWTARGSCKEDGHTQVYFPEGPLRYDNAWGFRNLFAAICRAQDRCYEIMKIF